MIGSLRARLTTWYMGLLAAALVAVCLLTWFMLNRALHARVDENLVALSTTAVTSLHNDLAEGQDVADAARSTAAELFTNQVMLAIHDGAGILLAEQGRDDDLELNLPAPDDIPLEGVVLTTVSEADDADDRHRLAIRRARIEPSNVEYIIVAGTDLEATDEEMASLRRILLSVVPGVLVVAGLVGWLLARQSLSPVVSMADRARRIGVENLDERLPVANPHDELGRLAATFNELLNRLASSFAQQRQFMADASHELRTPVATAQTAASVALQQPHRAEPEYRESLAIIGEQTTRLARVVEDMFTLARADAGSYPVRRDAVYLDELVDDVVRASRVLASTRNVRIDSAKVDGASFTGDEDLLRRMIANVVDNAVRHAPSGSAVTVSLSATPAQYLIAVSDAGPGIPAAAQSRIFERFYRGDPARQRERAEYGGAGLGLAIAQWAARQHGGDVSLHESTGNRTTFEVRLPH